MLDLTKKLSIKKGHVVFKFESKTYMYKDVTKEKVTEILSILDSNINSDTYCDADSLSKEKLKNLKGKELYKRAAYFTKLARKGAGFTQKELSKKLKITQPNLSSMENARRPIGKVLAKRLSTIFKIHHKVFLSD
jgi:ribosome-binding protein aMBF1 (putative translation factor)